jgi:hypothetical protein
MVRSILGVGGLRTQGNREQNGDELCVSDRTESLIAELDSIQ